MSIRCQHWFTVPRSSTQSCVPSSSAGTVEVWVTSDGSVFVEGETTLNLVFGLFVHLKETVGDLVVEDRITDVVHNEASLLRLVRREEAAMVPWETAA